MREGTSSPIRKAFYLVEEGRVRRYEQDAWRRSSGLVLTSAREEEMAKEVAPDTATAVVPNGVDTEYFTPGSGRDRAADDRLQRRPRLPPESRRRALPRRRGSAARPRDASGRARRRRRPRRSGRAEPGPAAERRGDRRGTGRQAVPRAGRGRRRADPRRERNPLQGRRRPGDVEADGLDRGRLRGHRSGARAAPAHRRLRRRTFASAIVQLFDDAARSLRPSGRAGREFVEREYSWARAGERLQALYDVVLEAR